MGFSIEYLQMYERRIHLRPSWRCTGWVKQWVSLRLWTYGISDQKEFPLKFLTCKRAIFLHFERATIMFKCCCIYAQATTCNIYDQMSPCLALWWTFKSLSCTLKMWKLCLNELIFSHTAMLKWCLFLHFEHFKHRCPKVTSFKHVAALIIEGFSSILHEIQILS